MSEAAGRQNGVKNVSRAARTAEEVSRGFTLSTEHLIDSAAIARISP
jgi:hypothetical protein